MVGTLRLAHPLRTDLLCAPAQLHAAVCDKLARRANRTRDRGCSKHPVFPAPSDFEEGQTKVQTSGETCREKANPHSVVIAREGGRSSIPETSMIEPISRSVLDAPPSRGMTGRCFRRMGGAQRYPSPHAPALMGIAALHPSYGLANGNIAFCGAAKLLRGAPSNGQWQFGWLLCIGATGMQASGPRSRAPRKITEETCTS